jgi:hypothetical protein
MWIVTAQLKAAECYVKIERKDAARDIYSKVLRNHGADSNWGKLARKGLDGIAAAGFSYTKLPLPAFSSACLISKGAGSLFPQLRSKASEQVGRTSRRTKPLYPRLVPQARDGSKGPRWI